MNFRKYVTSYTGMPYDIFRDLAEGARRVRESGHTPSNAELGAFVVDYVGVRHVEDYYHVDYTVRLIRQYWRMTTSSHTPRLERRLQAFKDRKAGRRRGRRAPAVHAVNS